jgi:maleylpyruvate isomerase
MTDHPELPDALDALHQSEQRLLRTVDSLPVDAWTKPSVLPGWTRAHVAAHLALNAEGLTAALVALQHGHEAVVYDSDESRDADIETLGRAAPTEIRERLFAAGHGFRNAVASLSPAQWDASVLRAPGGPAWPVASLPGTRRREVEIHHADLDAGYSPHDWPGDFVTDLLDVVTADHAASSDSPTFTIRATDTSRTWSVGAAHPVVEGAAADLAWWLVGRGHGEGLACPDGLPRLGPWRRTQAPTRAP